MEKTGIVVRKKVEGEIQYNDGQFAEIQTYGIEETETGLFLELSRFTERTPTIRLKSSSDG